MSFWETIKTLFFVFSLGTMTAGLHQLPSIVKSISRRNQMISMTLMTEPPRQRPKIPPRFAERVVNKWFFQVTKKICVAKQITWFYNGNHESTLRCNLMHNRNLSNIMTLIWLDGCRLLNHGKNAERIYLRLLVQTYIIVCNEN